MGLFARLARLIKSNINALITSAEDPEKMLEQLIDDMAQQLADAKKQVASAMADEKRLARQVEQQAKDSQEWERKAMLAVRANNDALAKEALARRKEHDALAAQYREQWHKQKQGVDQLKLALRALNGKIEEAKRKKGILIARQKRAEAQKAIHETLSGMERASAFAAFEQMEGRIEQLESHAEASAEISEEYTGDTLANKFRELESATDGESELLALKQRMGIAPAAAAALPEKPPVVTTGVRVDTGQGDLDADEQRELADALAELEAEERTLGIKR
jgi:phage shock protein A